jgi:hypothetical protein
MLKHEKNSRVLMTLIKHEQIQSRLIYYDNEEKYKQHHRTFILPEFSHFSDQLRKYYKVN